MSDIWDAHARWWQDEFTDGADPEYVEQILPLIAQHLPETGVLLDIGMGEGQVGRMAAAAGLTVVGLDPSWRQVEVAAGRGGVSGLQASATAVPLVSGCADVAVACLVFEHIEDHLAAIAEVARVVRPGGAFLFLLNHPLLQTPGSGWIDDQILDPPEQYWRIGPYLPEADSTEEVTKGVFIRFFHRPLSNYLNGLIDAGFVLEAMVEPAPPDGFLAAAPEYDDAADIPRLLFLRLRRS